MSAINTSMRSIRAPLQAMARRQFSSTTTGTSGGAATGSIPLTVGHSNKKLAIASAVSFAVGIDVTYAYYNFFQTSKWHCKLGSFPGQKAIGSDTDVVALIFTL